MSRHLRVQKVRESLKRQAAPDGYSRSIPHTIPELYAGRNVVERCVNRLEQWCAKATRYEKRAAIYRAIVVIASLMIWLAT